MKKLILPAASLLLTVSILAGCNTSGTAETSSSETTEVVTSETTTEETSTETTETTKEEIVYEYETEIPENYKMSFKDGESGTVEKITYHANDYIGDGEGCDKNAFVYLPAGYDPEGQYNVIYLMNGIVGNEDV